MVVVVVVVTVIKIMIVIFSGGNVFVNRSIDRLITIRWLPVVAGGSVGRSCYEGRGSFHMDVPDYWHWHSWLLSTLEQTNKSCLENEINGGEMCYVLRCESVS